MGASAVATQQAVGNDLLAVLPNDGRKWYQRGHIVYLQFCLFSLIMFSSANGYDGSLMNGIQALDQWHEFMDMPTGAWLGFINAVYWLGNGITCCFTPYINNKYGRKLLVYIGYIFMALGIALCASDKPIGFVLSRFFVGCASACWANVVPLLINEIAYPTHRGIASALFNCGWYVGGTVAAFITFGTRNMANDWSWRIPTILQVLIPVLILPGLILSPQSPRWLMSVDRHEEARVMLEKWHAGGDKDSLLVNYEMIEISETIRIEREAHSSASYAEMFKTPGMRHRLWITLTVAVFAQWAGNGVVSYYLSLVLDTVGVTSVTDQTLIAVGINIWNLIFSVTAAFMVDRLGRRFLFLASSAIMFVGFVTVTGLSGSFAATGNAATGIAVIPFLFVFFAGYDIALTPLIISYTCEICPYRLRSRGLTVALVTTVIAIFFNTFVNPIALEAIGWKYYFVFLIVIVTMAITVYFTYPETRGHTLEQMAVVFEGRDADVAEAAETVFRSASVVSGMEKTAHLHEPNTPHIDIIIGWPFVALDVLKSAMDALLSLAFDNISSREALKIRKGLRQIEGLLAQICLAQSKPRSPKKRAQAEHDGHRGHAKGLSDLREDAAFREFFRLQEGFQCNVASRLLSTLERLLGFPPSSQNDLVILSTLDLIQGLLILHPPSRALFSREDYLNILLDLLDSANPPAVQSAALLVLMTAMLENPRNMRTFESIDGLLTVTSLYKTRSTSRDVRLRAMEFLYLYLMPEVGSQKASSAPNAVGLQRSPTKLAALSGHARTHSGDSGNAMDLNEDDTGIRSMEEKQKALAQFLDNVPGLVHGLREGGMLSASGG
ncbi:hypothetical protein B0A48_08387 [Cryoendolithus antarcticus]|uniref:Major facilitator superfamily (MFS) profile domain-containing protein n=1 Tax=Cryoendolithus antarcticus TaxID=1507870 RepID=A0A1V8T608_9PEZI|nr:hypothetical protein B0A48_08387 [Cryoendolithus antarcticus]